MSIPQAGYTASLCVSRDAIAMPVGQKDRGWVLLELYIEDQGEVGVEEGGCEGCAGLLYMWSDPRMAI